MRALHFGPLEVFLCGGPDRQGGGKGPLVVLFHGYGAPGDDLVGIYRGLDVDRSFRFAFPKAPIVLEDALGLSRLGLEPPRAWWPVDVQALEEAILAGRHRDLSQSLPQGLREAEALASKCLDALEEALEPSHLVIGGFSQGAMLATSIALSSERRLDGLVAWSGTYLNEAEWRLRMSKRKGLRAFVSHGKEDPLLPFDAAERLAQDMTAAGWQVLFVPFRGQHQIPGIVLDRFEKWLRELFAA
ncbi:MAG: dienelactone hydrolase family protein [Sandaracinaceae bacterium]|nr:dienelactone hydrolase family protein [Sandaracinaceae bacterium]